MLRSIPRRILLARNASLTPSFTLPASVASRRSGSLRLHSGPALAIASRSVHTTRGTSAALSSSSPTSETLHHPTITSPTPSMTVPLSMPVFPPSPPIPRARGPVALRLPPTEDRPHRFLTLENGLECIIVSDPKADKAAASMEVGVGHLSDPDNLAGCAHFCEHLMFLGTKKYPSENDYRMYLTANNGGSNAWTGMTSTNYFFDVAPGALEGALDRFSGFFTEPLFSEDCTEREIKAVNSEHEKNLQNDMWRFFQLEKSFSKPGHVYGKFGTGNLDTLWNQPRAEGRDPRDQLLKWWEHHYCARRMKLAVAGREDLDTLEKMVRDKFSNVPIRTEGRPETGPDGVRITFDDLAWGPDMRGVVAFAKPVRDVRGLEVVVPVPDLQHLPDTKPFNFLSHLLGHEGKGSVLSYLKRQGWCNALRAGCHRDGNGFGFFKVTVELTEKGLEHWKDVSAAIFNYMALLRNNPPDENSFNEIRQLSDISFKFMERTKTRSYVTSLTGWMQTPVEREDIVTAQYLLGDFDAKQLADAAQLLDPTRAAVCVTAREFPKDITASFDKKEKVYGTEYHVQPLPEELLNEAVSGVAIPELHLPGPNPFIPERLDVEKKEVQKPTTRPELVSDTELSRLWFKHDDRFWVPKTNIFIEAKSPILDITPRNAVLARLLCDLFTDANVEEVYDAELASLHFHTWYAGESISMSVQGFTDKQALLLEKMLTKLTTFETDPERFDKIVERLKLQWKNMELGEPWHLGHYWEAYATTQRMWTPKERLAEIEHVTPADVDMFAREIFGRIYLEMLVHGNTNAAEAKGIQEMMERVLAARALVPAEKTPRRALQIPPNSQHVWVIPVANPLERNNAVDYYVETRESTDFSTRAQNAMLGQIMNEPAFSVLRTQEQLGYVVQVFTVRNGIRVIVQSERNPVYVESRIETFLESVQKLIEDMSDEDFNSHRQTLILKREEQPKNLGEETRRYWHRITDNYYEFSKHETEIRELKAVTKAQVLDFFMTKVHPASSTRAKFSIHMASQAKAKGTKFDPASAAAIMAGFAKHGVAVDQAALGALAATNPELKAVQEYGRKLVAGADISTEAATELNTLIDGLEAATPNPADAEATLREGNVLIEDINAFKASLTPSKAAVPLEPLVLSKL